MRKSPIWRGEWVVWFPSRLLIAFVLFIFPSTAAQDAPKAGFSVFIRSQIERQKAEVQRTRDLVANGTLARLQLTQAENRLADLEDEGVLAETLYGSVSVDKMTEKDAANMLAAAQRRVDRQAGIVDERRRLLEGGAIPQAEFEVGAADLETRRQVLVLAQNRMKLIDDLRLMAETEKRVEKTADTPRRSFVRYDGNGSFSLADVPTISSQFEHQFHHALPISALGQTLLHQSMGLDHRNRVDVAVSPDSNEGVWLRKLLEKLRVPYLAFSSAIAGAATAPHIHIGIESTRLKVTGGN